MALMMTLCTIIDMKNVPIVDLLMDKKMCAVLNTIPERASVEPCLTKKRFICVGLKKCEEEKNIKSTLPKDHFQCSGNCLLQLQDV